MPSGTGRGAGRAVKKRSHRLSDTVPSLPKSGDRTGVFERRYRDLVENAPIGIYRSTRDGRFLDANLAFARKLGYGTAQEVLSLDLRADVYLDPADRERLFAESERLGGTATFEVQLKRKDGTPVWVRLDSRTIRDQAGNALFCEGFVRDIGAQKRAERRLVAFSNLGRKLSSAETPEETAYVLTSCADELWSWDACTVDLYFAEYDLVEPLLSMDVIGGRRQAIVPVREGVAPSPRQRRVLREGALVISRDVPPEGSDSIPFGDTGRLSASILIAPIHKGAQVVGFVSVQSYTPRAFSASDLDTLQSAADLCGGALARIRATEKLRKSESLLREAQHAGHIGSWEWNVGRNVVSWSEEHCRIFGLNPGEFGGTPEAFVSFVVPEDRARIQALMEESLLTHEPYESEYRIRRLDGQTRTISARAEVVLDARGRPERVIGTAHDVTERKKIEEEVRGSRERLRALSRRLIEAQETERSRLARELHDEIGQALTAVKINLQGAHPSEERLELSARIADSLEIIDRTMKQVRDISIALRPSLLDDVGLVAALRWYIDSQAVRSGFRAHFETDPSTIRLPPELAINCYRVVQEAVTNVARHAGARELRVNLRVRKEEIEIRVRDDGVGFDVPASRDRSRRGESFGILSMTERVRLLGGRLEIDSSPGRGTEVRARFPRTREEQ